MRTSSAWRRLIRLFVCAAAVALTSIGLAPAGASVLPSAAPDGARVVAEQQVADRQIDLTVASPAMGADEKVRLLTPDGWDSRTPAQHWPTLWLLHGCCGDYTSWTSLTDIASIPELHHVLVVMPEAGNVGFYSNWLDGTANWETFHLREVMPIVDRDFGASTDRTIAGLSMGGFGAVSYTARHPSMFRATASFSGLVDTRLPGASDNIQGFLRAFGQDPDGLWGDPVSQWPTWAAHNPTDLAPLLLHQPLFLSTGNGDAGPFDQPGTHDSGEALYGAENHALADRLTAMHDRHLITDFYGNGQHKWAYWQRELHRALPLLTGAMQHG